MQCSVWTLATAGRHRSPPTLISPRNQPGLSSLHPRCRLDRRAGRGASMHPNASLTPAAAAGAAAAVPNAGTASSSCCSLLVGAILSITLSITVLIALAFTALVCLGSLLVAAGVALRYFTAQAWRVGARRSSPGRGEWSGRPQNSKNKVDRCLCHVEARTCWTFIGGPM